MIYMISKQYKNTFSSVVDSNISKFSDIKKDKCKHIKCIMYACS